MAIKFAINGFGRIGRMVLRAALARQEKDIEIVAINDLDKPSRAGAPVQVRLRAPHVAGQGDGAPRRASSSTARRTGSPPRRTPTKLPWKELGVDVVLECTGRFTAREKAELHLQAGAKKVLISAPGKSPDITLACGINHTEYDPAKHHIISNASCTTNCLAPIAKVLHETLRHRARPDDDDPLATPTTSASST